MSSDTSNVSACNGKEPDVKPVKQAVTDAMLKEPNMLIQTDESSGQESFVMKNQSYYDIQAYIYSGMRLPATDNAFEEKIPEDLFSLLKLVDQDIYKKTKKTAVDVSASCNSFRVNTMGRLWSAPRISVEYCDLTIKKLKDNENNLCDYWMTVRDAKYRDVSSWDDTFHTALKRAKLIAESIRTEAEEKKGEMDALIKELQSFLMETTSLSNDVKDLDNLYNNKKVKQGDKEYDNIIAYLTSDLASLRNEMEIFAEQLRLHEKNMAYHSARMNAWFSIPLIGLIPGGIEEEKMKESIRAWNNTLANINQKGPREGKIVRLVAAVTSLSFQFKNLVEKMEKAITAMQQVRNVFNDQASNYSTITRHMVRISAGLDSEDYDMRDMNIKDNVNNAVESFNKVKKLAVDFMNNASIEEHIQEV